MLETTDPTLIGFYRQLHSTGAQFQGHTLKRYASTIGKLVRRTDAATILDYGSGAGAAWPSLSNRLGVKVKRYDPGIPAIATKPPEGTVFDGVICVDVLEHLLPEHVDNVIAELFAYAGKFVFATVCCRPAKKKFTDGRNMHTAIMPASEWALRFQVAALSKPDSFLWLLRETI